MGGSTSTAPNVLVAASNLRGDTEIEVFTGWSNVTEEPFVCWRVLQNGKGRHWIMLDPKQWSKLKSATEKRLKRVPVEIER